MLPCVFYAKELFRDYGALSLQKAKEQHSLTGEQTYKANRKENDARRMGEREKGQAQYSY